MTDEALHDLIAGDAAAKALADAGDDTGAAARAAAIAPREVRETRGTYLTIANQCGADVARRLIQTIDLAAAADPLVAEARYRLRDEQGGVDIGHELTRQMLDSFALAELPLTAADATAIRAIAEYAPTITADDVSRAWSRYRPGGSIRV